MDSVTNAYYNLESSDDSKSTQHHSSVKDLNIDALLRWLDKYPSEINMITISWMENKDTVKVTMTKK